MQRLMKNDRIGRKAAKLLQRSGWTSDREVPEAVEAFVKGRAKELSPAAKRFILSFGGLDVGALLWIWSEPHENHPSTSFESRISKIVKSEVVPVASASYFSSNCVIWIDECNRFFGADDDGVIYLAEGLRDFFDVVLFDQKRAVPPLEIRSSLEGACEW